MQLPIVSPSPNCHSPRQGISSSIRELHQLDWVSLLKKNRNLEVNSFVLHNDQGLLMSLTGPHIKVDDLVLQILANAY